MFHDLSVVKHISDRVAVMYLGRLVELAGKKQLYDDAQHPYTCALLSAAPIAKPGAKKVCVKELVGDLPSPLAPPLGCHFHPRCPEVMSKCREEIPEFREHRPGHWVRCFLYSG